jgi:hypothetical protein
LQVTATIGGSSSPGLKSQVRALGVPNQDPVVSQAIGRKGDRSPKVGHDQMYGREASDPSGR